MVDLEGTVFLRPDDLQPAVQLALPRHARAPINLLQEMFPGEINTTLRVEWTLSGEPVQAMLKLMLPHLHRLRRQAEIIANTELGALTNLHRKQIQELNREMLPIPETPVPGSHLLALRVGDNWCRPQADLFSETGLEPLCGSWPESVTMVRSVVWIHNTTDWLSVAEGSSVCSLASILEPQVDRKYYLSARACAGILRRAKKRGKTVPAPLMRALEAVTKTTPTKKG